MIKNFFQNTEKSEFFKNSLVANFIIILTMVPQFLLVPIILNFWGEAQYSSYVVFLSVLNIAIQINGAMQNGYINRLFQSGKISVAELSSMFLLNLGLLSFMLILLFVFYVSGYGAAFFSHITLIILSLPFLFALSSLKIIYQLGHKVTTPLLISFAQSTFTILIFILVLAFGSESQFRVSELIFYGYIVTLIVCALFAKKILNKYEIDFDQSLMNIKESLQYILRFGGQSLFVAIIINVFINGTKVYLGDHDDTSVLLNFNLSFTLCMIVFQFINPILGLIFPYLAKRQDTLYGRLVWIYNIHKVFWCLASLIYLMYSFILIFIIRLWLGDKYTYLNDYVLLFIFYFTFFESASIGVQFFKVIDKQKSTLIFSIISFIILPFLGFLMFVQVNVWSYISLFIGCSAVFYICISAEIIRYSWSNLFPINSYIIDMVFGLALMLICYNLKLAGISFFSSILLVIFSFLYIIFWIKLSPLKKFDKTI